MSAVKELMHLQRVKATYFSFYAYLQKGNNSVTYLSITKWFLNELVFFDVLKLFSLNCNVLIVH
jgi:hypothetical protein